jgi:phosphatidylcholine synthase
MLARRAGLPAATPMFDGARLDDIVDYLTFVFVPLFLLQHTGRLPPRAGIAIVAAALVASAYGFSREDAKSDDHFFTGFPSYWNIVALYLHAARTPPTWNAVILLGLVVMVFVRIGYVYPSRTPVLRGLTNLLGAAWAVLMLAVVWLLPDAPRALVIGSLFFPVYYTVLSFWLHAQRRPRVSGA